MRMGMARWIRSWPVYRQLTGPDPLGRGKAAESRRSETLVPRTESADRVVSSVCPYCAVGCAQRVYVSGERVIQIEGNQDSPISRGRLCPKGSASKQLVTGPQREHKVLYRPPYGTSLARTRPGHRDGHDRGPGAGGAPEGLAGR